jgi:16S rRNA (cytidine1402-2'-O)-methyltransferase
VAHELTKMFENVEHGTLSTLLEGLTEQNLRGEHVVVIAGVGKRERDDADGE